VLIYTLSYITEKQKRVCSPSVAISRVQGGENRSYHTLSAPAVSAVLWRVAKCPRASI